LHCTSIGGRFWNSAPARRSLELPMIAWMVCWAPAVNTGRPWFWPVLSSHTKICEVFQKLLA